ncbi:MAG: VIT1/CCC1 transporter family protein [bacterium]|nr:VIT1/CCC1 transporter family protein [bacterium]
MRSGNKSSYYRNFIFGVEDSLVSTVGLLSGISIAGVTNATILVTGIVLIFVEAISMGAGSFLSESSAEMYESRREEPTNRSYFDALIMFVSYLVSGFVPLLPYIILPQGIAFWTSIGLSLAVLFLLGIFGARMSNTSMWRSVARMVLVGGGAIAVGSVVGRLFG